MSGDEGQRGGHTVGFVFLGKLGELCGQPLQVFHFLVHRELALVQLLLLFGVGKGRKEV